MKNKVYGILFTALGVVSVLLEKDATFFVLSAGIGLPLIFAKKNWIV